MEVSFFDIGLHVTHSTVETVPLPTRIIPLTSFGGCQVEDRICLLRTTTGYLRTNSRADPLQLQPMRIIQRGYFPVQIDLSLHQVELAGLSNASLNHVTGMRSRDGRQTKFEIDLRIPSITLTGFYEIAGNFTIVPIEGRGNVTFFFENINARAKFTIGQKLQWRKSYTILESARLSRFSYKK